jgi:hypothetical protein
MKNLDLLSTKLSRLILIISEYLSRIETNTDFKCQIEKKLLNINVNLTFATFGNRFFRLLCGFKLTNSIEKFFLVPIKFDIECISSKFVTKNFELKSD